MVAHCVLELEVHIRFHSPGWSRVPVFDHVYVCGEVLLGGPVYRASHSYIGGNISRRNYMKTRYYRAMIGTVITGSDMSVFN